MGASALSWSLVASLISAPPLVLSVLAHPPALTRFRLHRARFGANRARAIACEARLRPHRGRLRLDVDGYEPVIAGEGLVRQRASAEEGLAVLARAVREPRERGITHVVRRTDT